MIPLGYMLKAVASPAPDWMKSPQVEVVHSLSGCLSVNFADYINLWQHNGWWLFDSPSAVQQAAESLGTLADTHGLYYYEAFSRQFDEDSKSWEPIEPETTFATCVAQPNQALVSLSGYDVVTFSQQVGPECSPLSCNGFAASLPANSCCLFDSLTWRDPR